MMISPQSYIEDKKYWSVEKLNIEKNRLKTDIEQYKKGIAYIKDYMTNPSPDVIYAMNQEYLLELEKLIKMKTDKQEIQEGIYYYLSVKYTDDAGDKEYNYISKNDTVEVGDYVLVDRANRLAIGEVMDAKYFEKGNTPFPIEKTKEIIRVVDKNFKLEDLYFFEESDEINTLRIKADGTYFKFAISNYTNKKNNDENWTNNYIMVYNHYFKYKKNAELLTSAEVENLLYELQLLIDDKINEIEEVEFLEPDIKFVLYPKINLWDTGKYEYIKEGYEVQDVFIEVNINLTDDDGVYTGQKYVIPFSRDGITYFVDYLHEIIEGDNNNEK